jgi:hypothetical protein
MSSLVCRQCFDADGIDSVAVIETLCTNDLTGQQYTAFVCTRCLARGRETRVTCRTFQPVDLLPGRK